MKNEKLFSVIRASWGEDTCHTTRRIFRKKELPEIGQCAITAAIVEEFLGGKILYCSHHHHYRNQIDDGTIIDLTKKQFSKSIKFCIDKTINRKDIFSHKNAKTAETKERYIKLKNRIEDLISKK